MVLRLMTVMVLWCYLGAQSCEQIGGWTNLANACSDKLPELHHCLRIESACACNAKLPSVAVCMGACYVGLAKYCDEQAHADQVISSSGHVDTKWRPGNE